MGQPTKRQKIISWIFQIIATTILSIAAYEKFLALDEGRSDKQSFQARQRIRTLKRELERLKRIARAEGVYDDARFRDEIAKERDAVAGSDVVREEAASRQPQQ
mgnify:CR=1 FL=1